MQKLKKKVAKKPTKSGAESPAPSGQPPEKSEKKLTTEEIDQIRAQEIQALNNNGYFRYNQLLQIEVLNENLAQVNENLQKLGAVIEDLVEQVKPDDSEEETTKEAAEEPAEETTEEAGEEAAGEDGEETTP